VTDVSSRFPKLVVLALALLLALNAAILWSTIRLHRRLDELGSATQAPRELEAKVPGEPPPVTSKGDAIPIDRRIAFDSFLRIWEPGFAAQAERECWLPLEKATPPARLTTTPQFELKIDATGRVTDVSSAPEDLELAPQLMPCLERIIRTMRFPAPGQSTSGRVQASRPTRK
jgi:hypothetical protein